MRLPDKKPKQKGTVVAVCNQLKKHRDSITVPIVFEDLNDIKKSLEDVISNDPEFFYVQNFYLFASRASVTINPIYLLAKDDVDNIRSLCEKQAGKIIDKTVGKSEYDKARLIHDTLAKNITYKDDGKYNRHTIVGPLIERKAVCDGYSKAFSYILTKIGIENLLIRGSAKSPTSTKEEPHAWNMVKLNGYWCHVDVTFDSTLSNDFLRHDYFCLTDSMITMDHKYDETAYPVAEMKGMDYYTANKCLMVGRESFKNYIMAGLRDNKAIIPVKLPSDVPDNNLIDKVSNTLQELLMSQRINTNYTIEYNLAQRVFIIRFDM